MGKVCNKSFIQVHKSISKKSNKLLDYLIKNKNALYGGEAWHSNNFKIYDKLIGLCEDVSDEISNFDEIKMPGEE